MVGKHTAVELADRCVDLFVLALGIAMFLSSAVAAAAAVFIVGWVLNRCMQLEERMIKDVMGERYRSWKEQRCRFIPYVY